MKPNKLTPKQQAVIDELDREHIKALLKRPIPPPPRAGHSLDHEEACFPKPVQILLSMSLGFPLLPALVTQYYCDGTKATGYKAVRLNKVIQYPQ